MPTTPLLGIPQVSSSQNNKELTINDAFLAVENAMSSSLSISLAASSNVTLSETQATRSFIYIANAATVASTLRFPNTIAGINFNRVLCVQNTSGYDLTVRFATGAGSVVVIPDGSAYMLLALNGLDVVAISAP